MLRTHHYTKEKPRTRGFFQSLIVCEAKTSLQYSCYLYQLSIRITKSCGFVGPCKEFLEKLQFKDFRTFFQFLQRHCHFRIQNNQVLFFKCTLIRKTQIIKITWDYFACKTSLFHPLNLGPSKYYICLKMKQQIFADLINVFIGSQS